MTFRHACTLAAAAVLSCAVASAQSTQEPTPQPAGATAATQAPPQASTPSPAEPQPESVGRAGAQQVQAERTDELPRTASPLPIAGLLALFSLGGAFGIRALRRR
jgi:hypothetical protein